MAIEAVTQGKEHLILLPSEDRTLPLPDVPPGVVARTGAHAVVISGHAIFVHEGQPEPGGLALALDGPFSFVSDDDTVHTTVVELVVGPEWRNVFQVSPIVSPAGVQSWDSDEVDHSLWVVRSCAWDTKQTLAGERIRLEFEIEVQGAGNGFVNFAYQLVATGDLWDMPSIDDLSADFTT